MFPIKFDKTGPVFRWWPGYPTFSSRTCFGHLNTKLLQYLDSPSNNLRSLVVLMLSLLSTSCFRCLQWSRGEVKISDQGELKWQEMKALQVSSNRLNHFVFKSTVGIWIPDTWIPETFENQTFRWSVWKQDKIFWISNGEHHRYDKTNFVLTIWKPDKIVWFANVFFTKWLPFCHLIDTYDANHLKSRPFTNRTKDDLSKTRLVRFSNPHCTNFTKY